MKFNIKQLQHSAYVCFGLVLIASPLFALWEGSSSHMEARGKGTRANDGGFIQQPAPTTDVPRESCATAECHGNVKEHDFIHGPVNVNACDACHVLTDPATHTYTMARESQEMCLFCHEVDLAGAQTVHEPLKTGDCMACHNPHGGPNRAILQAASPAESCAECHEDVIGDNTHTHGPVAAGACNACHSPHTSPHPNLLSSEPREMCLQCHVTTKNQLEGARFIHGPANVDCLACHDAHATNHPMMLREDRSTICMSCHESIQHIVETATEQHAAVTTDRECLNCHDAHASDHPRVLKQDMMSLCFECHDREIEMEDGRKLADIKAVIEGGHSLHGPVAQANCAACHEIHGGGNFRLLVEEYPPQFYAPFKEESYALCFSCHEKELVEDATTTTLTNFRNGDTNLHFLHVNREKKGRTCRACHETHASNKEKHIRDSVPFGTGGWKLPINFQYEANGGSCAPGCHQKFEYNRVEPVVYEHLDNGAIWPDENAPDSGNSDNADNGGNTESDNNSDPDN